MMINIIATRESECDGARGKSRRQNSPANNIDSVEIEIIFRRLRSEESKSKERENIKNLFLPVADFLNLHLRFRLKRETLRIA